MPLRLRACLFPAVALSGFLQAGVCLAQQLPSVPGPPKVPTVPRPAGVPSGGTGGLRSGISSFGQNPSAAPVQGRRFDAGGVGAVPGADSATQSTNATNATAVTGGTGYSNRRR